MRRYEVRVVKLAHDLYGVAFFLDDGHTTFTLEDGPPPKKPLHTTNLRDQEFVAFIPMMAAWSETRWTETITKTWDQFVTWVSPRDAAVFTVLLQQAYALSRNGAPVYVWEVVE